MQPTQTESRAGKKRTALLVSAFGAAVVVPSALLLFVLIQSGGLGNAAGTHHSQSIVSPGMEAPDFSLTSQDGRPFHLSDYKGRAVFLAFVPSWKDTKTVEEARSLRSQIGNFDDAGAKVMLVSNDTSSGATQLHDSEKLPYPLLIDANGTISKAWGVPQGDFRTTFVVNPSGKVRYRLSDAAVDAAHHGPQLIDVSKCCVDDVMAARAHGIGKVVGDFSLPRMDAADHPMTTIFGDGTQKATVVLFMSVKCPCSNAYNDRIKALADQYTGRGIRVVGIYANQDETPEEIAKHAHDHGFDFPILKDDKALCADHFGASVTPEVFALDSSRVLRYAGRIDSDRDIAQVKTHDLSEALDTMLAGKELAHRDTHAFGCAIVRQAI